MLVPKSAISSLAILAASAITLTAATLGPQKPKKPAAANAKKTSAAAVSPSGSVDFAKHIAPLAAKYCGGCHGAKAQTGGINMTAAKTKAEMLKARGMWERAAESIASHRMPPPGLPQPTDAERKKLVDYVQTTLSTADCDVKDPGRVTMRRLNRAEYNNTVRDLIGLDLKPADEFPSDDVGYGFDNIGDVLSISPIHLERYVDAAEKIAKAAIFAEDPPHAPAHFAGAKLKNSNSGGTGGALPSTGEAYIEYAFPKEGDYVIRVRAYQNKAGNEAAKMPIKVGDTVLKTVDVIEEKKSPGTYSARVSLTGGKRKVAAGFLNDFYDDSDKAAIKDRNLIVEEIEIVGPMLPRPKELPDSHRRILFEEPTEKNRLDVARKIMSRFATRAWRRPAEPGEVDRLLNYVKLAEKEGESFERGIQLAVQAALVSPHFLFRVEIDARPNDPKMQHTVNPYELASRLSYFLWSSMPDDELFALAAQKKLVNKPVLEAQVRRMLKDKKARGLVDNFMAQWLHLRLLASATPDAGRFPGFNDQLKAAMRTETELFCEAVIREDRSVLDFIDGRYTYVNERLAKHYDMPGVTGDEFRRVALTDPRRGGVITQASILTITSNPTRTSPVKRGKWILEQILGTPPPPPPPNVPEIKEDEHGAQANETLRQKLERHRKDPACATCHLQMDALGFGFENFNPVGGWRDKEGALEVDASGALPTGGKFKGPADLRKILLGEKKKFARSFTDKLMTFALGRGLEYYDRCAVDEIAVTAAKENYRFSAIVAEIVKSDPFRMRRGDGGPK
jgi:mono/diheme cytochrome c family protein